MYACCLPPTAYCLPPTAYCLPPTTNLHRRVESHADDRARWQFDVLAFGRCDYAAAADNGADQRTLQTADDAADDRADASSGADRGCFVTDPLAFEDLR